jgi:starch synthase (maltosyl-transferring)
VRVSLDDEVWKGGQVLPRIEITATQPSTPSRLLPAKAAVGDPFVVSADIFRDGHDLLAAAVRAPDGTVTPLVHVGNDRWEAVVTLSAVGTCELRIDAWTDRFTTWRRDITAKAGAGQDVTTELEEGALLLELLAPEVPAVRRPLLTEAAASLRRSSCTTEVRLNAGLDDAVAAAVAGVPLPGDVTSQPLVLWVDRRRGLFSTWYELFPRSEGGFLGATKRLPAVADMGFDIVYLPPIHPIGRTARKGRNNSVEAAPDDVGSPWAIGGPEGGHLDIHPDLGTAADLRALVAEARSLGMEVALDYALQCSPDHPWVRTHPEWFHHRPDGTIKYAENPPKKYQDIYPINFWPVEDADRQALWEECKAILDHWIGEGIQVFRVDNPHTKPIAFWAWLIPAVHAEHPEVLFLAEAFTRPKVMARLAEVGFSLSYTYFTWRTTKDELTEYVTELTTGPTSTYMRPSFWPNTPDILAEPLRHGSPAAFRLRLLLAATLSPSYGIYSGYELCENEPQSDANEEYLASEKYEVKTRDWSRTDTLAPLVTTLNRARHAHPALQRLGGTVFHQSSKDALLVYSRVSADGGDVLLCVVNLDPEHWQEDTLHLDLEALGIGGDEPFVAHDLLTDQRFTWSGPSPYVRLDPADGPGHLLHLQPVGS